MKKIEKLSGNFFKVPHLFEEKYGEEFTSAEKYFFVILLKIENRFASKDGWFWHKDEKFQTKLGLYRGFATYGLSVSTCKRARKKLKEINLINTKYGWNKNGHKRGTFYQINYGAFKSESKKNRQPSGKVH